MTQRQLESLVATATGESSQTIEQLGFSIADPICPQFDPEGEYLPPAWPYLDWDHIDRQRSHSLAFS